MHFVFALGNPSEMFVTWSTHEDPGATVVEFGAVSLTTAVNGTRTYFNDSTSQYIHRVTLTGLKPQTKYCKLKHIASFI